MKTRLLYVVLIFILFNNDGFTQQIARSQYFAQMPFWESPIVPFRGEYPITKEQADKRINLKLDYDEHNRIIQVSARVGNELKPFEGFFGNLYINAPRTTVHYEDLIERHHFFDILGNRIAVQNNVYEKVYTKDKHGRNVSLAFFDKGGQPTEDLDNNRNFEWTYKMDGSIVEKRTDKEGNIVPLRGVFQLMLTRITFGSDGQVNMLQNIDEEGTLINAECGASTFKYFYDQHGRFLLWKIYDKEGNPAIGPSNTAGEQNVFEGINFLGLFFFDKEGKPATHWSGAERWAFKNDHYGNFTEVSYLDASGNLKLGSGGNAGVRFDWDENGRFLKSETYINLNGHPMDHPKLGIATTKYTRNEKGLILAIDYLDAEGKKQARKDNKVTSIKRTYDDKGLLIKSIKYDEMDEVLTQ